MKRPGFDRWFKLYHRRFWDSDEVLVMEPDVAGVYLFLLGVQAERGALPGSPDAIRTLVARFKDELWARAWPVLEPLFPIETDGKRRNAVQKAEIGDVEDDRETDRVRKAREREEARLSAGRPADVHTASGAVANGSAPDVRPQKREEEKREETPLPPEGEAPHAARGPRASPARDPEPDLDVALAEFPALTEPACRDAIAAWVRHRRGRRKGFTPESLALQLAQMAELGPARTIAAVESSIAAGFLKLDEPAPRARSPEPVAAKVAAVPALTAEQQAGFAEWERLNRERFELREGLRLPRQGRNPPDKSVLAEALDRLRLEVANMRTDYGRKKPVGAAG